MHDLQKTTALKALKTLDALGVPYAAIIDGETHGTLEIKTRRTRTREPRYAYGETRAHYLPLIQNMAVGDVVDVPVGQFDLPTLSSNVTAFASHEWGKGNTVTQSNKDAGTVTVLRIG